MSPWNDKTTADEIAAANRSAIRGKVVLVTGVSPSSLGASFVETVAKYEPHLLILAGRSVSKSQKTAEAIKASSPNVKTRILELDLGSQEKVRQAAQEVMEYSEPAINVLVNNAGIMAYKYGINEDGLETQFGSNHIGHFLFTNLIMKKILAAGPGSRVVSVSSDGHRLSHFRFDDIGFDDGKVYNKWKAYGQTKTANMLFAVALAEKLGKQKGLVAVSLHPGVIHTNFGSDLEQADFSELVTLDKELGNKEGQRKEIPWKSMAEGTATHMYAAFDPSLSEHNGAYLMDSSVIPAQEVISWARDSLEAEKLWKLSEKIVGESFAY